VSQLESRASFTVPAGAGSYAPERIQFNSQSTAVLSQRLTAVTALVESAVATAVTELWLLKAGISADPSSDANYFLAGTLTNGVQFLLSDWRGAQIRVKSGGTAGSHVVSASASGAFDA
jgi:hypothetical protein